MIRYLGDGVSVEWDGRAFKLTTDAGHGVTNRIYLEPAIVDAFARFVGERRAPAVDLDAEFAAIDRELDAAFAALTDAAGVRS